MHCTYMWVGRARTSLFTLLCVWIRLHCYYLYCWCCMHPICGQSVCLFVSHRLSYIFSIVHHNISRACTIVNITISLSSEATPEIYEGFLFVGSIPLDVVLTYMTYREERHRITAVIENWYLFDIRISLCDVIIVIYNRCPRTGRYSP